MPLVIRSDSDCVREIKLYNARLGQNKFEQPGGCWNRGHPYGTISGLRKSCEVFQRIPRSQWSSLIRAGKGTWLSDMRKGLLEPHDQSRTPLCWAHGSVRSVEVLRIYQGQKPLLLSAEQVAYVATGGRMRGGMPDEALKVLREVGTCDQNLWPLNSLRVKDADANYKSDRLRHVVLDWLDLENFDDQITLALNRVPVPIGLSWWGHLVCQLDPIDFEDGTYGVGIDNSWGPDWGDDGYGILHESKAIADLGAFAPISQTFSQI